ncbi:MAG: DUF4013 domain-containing protein [Methanospirillum sp.]
MDYGALLTDSVEFTRAALTGDLRRGAALVILYALTTVSITALPLVIPLDRVIRFAAIAVLVAISLVAALVLEGYAYRVYRRPRTPPDLDDPAGLALAGVRLIVVSIAYLLPVLAVLLIFGGLGIAGILASGQSQDMAGLFSALATLGLGILLALIVWVVIGMVSSLALVRCARRDGIREAFNFSAIIEHIGRIGWVNYIVALLVLWIVLGIAYVAVGIFSGLPVIGWVAGIVIGPAIMIFAARYLSLVYDSAPAP